MTGRKTGRILAIVIALLVLAGVVLAGFFSMRGISDKIYEDSTNQLREIYKIVGRSTKVYFEQKWRLLNDWKPNVTDSDFGFDTRREEWRYENFYFLARGEDGSVVTLTPEGVEGRFAASASWESLFGGAHMVTGERTADGEKMTLFAVPVDPAKDPHVYTAPDGRTFDFAGIGISFKNDSISYSLDTNPYSGAAECFVIHADGSVLFSVEEGGGVFANYLKLLRGSLAEGDEKDRAIIDDIEAGMKEGRESDLVTVAVPDKDGEAQNNVIYYQRLGYQDYYILSVVPQSTISSGLLTVQRNTVMVVMGIFSVIAVAVISLLIVRLWQQNRRAGVEIKFREQIFDVLSNSADNIFILIDAETTGVDYLSPNVEPLLGISVKDARADVRKLLTCAINKEDIYVPRDVLDELPLNVGRSWECEYMHQTTGERRWYRVTIYRVQVQGVGKYIVVMSDRTTEQQTKRSLQEAFDVARSANNAKSNFLSNMSHDIRTPMNAIIGFSALLERDAADVEKVREYTRKITASSHHLLSIINDVLDMSKIENGKTSLNMETFSLPQLLEELSIIVMPQAKAKGQSFAIRVGGNPPEGIYGDRLKLNRILMNILSNAVKYTPEGGKIDFTVTKIGEPSERAVKLRFVVKDNGIGMSEEYLARIFDPFSREVNSTVNKVQGTGLGMAITKNLVDLMGGIITVDSALGKGSTFTVELSFALSEKEEVAEWFRRNVRRMLVADDEAEVCENICEIMGETDVRLDCVHSGQEALNAVMAAQARGENYDVILLDWQMPGMDGLEAARRIRAEAKHAAPILVLTSYDWAEIEDEGRRAGINAFMSKPFFLSTFLHTIKDLFDKQPEAAPAKAADDVLRGKRFLVVEDNELNAEILTEMLSMEGAESDLAGNGREAVEKFLAEPPDRYDMILMDVQMPVMNGYEATQAIRASAHPRAATVPIVAMTANAFAEDVRDAQEAGMDGHLAKPIDMNKVRELIGRLLRERADDARTSNGGNKS